MNNQNKSARKPRLHANRIILRPLEERDAPTLYKNVKEYELARWTINIPHPYPENGAIEFIRTTQEKMEEGLAYELAIEARDASEVIGVMSLLKVDNKHKNAELGYWVARDHHNKGIATEAGSAILAFGFEELNLERIYSKCFVDNKPSQRVMEKLGMEYEGTSRHEVFKEDRFIDTKYFSILKDDWLENNATGKVKPQ